VLFIYTTLLPGRRLRTVPAVQHVSPWLTDELANILDYPSNERDELRVYRIVLCVGIGAHSHPVYPALRTGDNITSDKDHLSCSDMSCCLPRLRVV